MKSLNRSLIHWGMVVCVAVITVSGCHSSQPPPPRPVWTNYEINASVMAMAFEGKELWLGTEVGLIKYDPARDEILARYNSRNGLVSDIVSTIKLDSEGNLWVGTHGGGLAKFDGKSWKHFTVPDLADPYVYDILFDREGRMWVANWRGVSIYDGRKWLSYTQADGIIDKWVYALAMDHDGMIWLGTEGGVSRFDGRRFLSYTHRDGVGASREAVGAYEKIENPSRHHRNTAGKDADGYNPNYVLAVAVDLKNNKWFGTWGAGLTRFDGEKWISFTMRDGLSGNFISDILVDEDNSLYVATEGGVSVLREGRWSRYSVKDGLVDNGVFTVIRDDQGSKWFGTLKGISKLAGDSLAF